MAEPQFRAGTTATDTLGTLQITIPSGVQVGDVMVLTYITASSGSPTDLPAGWTYVPDDAPGVKVVSSGRMAALYRIAASGDAGTAVNLGVTAGAPVKQSAVLTAWSGADQTNPIHKAAFVGNTSPSTTHTVPSAVTTLGECAVVAWLGTRDSSVASITVPSGYTSRGTVTQTGGGRANSAQASKAATLAGSYGGETWTTDATPGSTGAWLIAIAPEPTTQTIRPIDDVTVTNITDQTGGITDCFTAVDEPTLSLTDYVTAVQGGTYECLLSTASTPADGSVLTVTYVLGLGDGASEATWDVYLMEGATQIAHWTDVVSTDPTEVSHTLTGGEYDAISGWSNLRLRFVLTSVTG